MNVVPKEKALVNPLEGITSQSYGVFTDELLNCSRNGSARKMFNRSVNTQMIGFLCSPDHINMVVNEPN